MSNLDTYFDSDSNESLIESLPPLEKTVSPKENHMNSLYSTGPWVNKNESSSSAENDDPVGNEGKSTTTMANTVQFGDKNSSSGKDKFIKGRPSACVFVASLKANLTDDELSVSVNNHFSQWGQLTTVKVLRDTSNRPYAFVQYTSDEESRLAIKNGHNSCLDGRNIRCEAAKVNRTLFITFKNLVNKKQVLEQYERYGEIEELIPSSNEGEIYSKFNEVKSYRNWFCKFVYRDDAIRAYANLQDYASTSSKVEWAQNVDRSKVNSKKFIKQFSRPKFDKFSIFIGQLNSKVEEKDLKNRFERHGEIDELNLIKKINNTFAFVKYKDESSAASAVERENHSMFCNKTMHVQYKENQNNPKQHVIALAPPPINLNKRNGGKEHPSKFASNFSNKSIKFIKSTNKTPSSPTQLSLKNDIEPGSARPQSTLSFNPSSYPLFYYVPVDNTEVVNTKAVTGPPFYNIYPGYFPPQSNANENERKEEISDVKEYSQIYNVPNFMYYPTEQDIETQEKKT